jgi:hypothetical protein
MTANEMKLLVEIDRQIDRTPSLANPAAIRVYRELLIKYVAQSSVAILHQVPVDQAGPFPTSATA